MSGLEKALSTLNAGTTGSSDSAISPVVQLPVTLGFIVAVISIPLTDPGKLLWFFSFPIVMAEASRLGYGKVFMHSLLIVPLIAIVGIFNPILDTVPAMTIGTLTISRGWITFVSILLRGLLSLQALIILVGSCGFNDVCRTLARLKVPSLLVTQLMMLYRFLTVLLDEALTMHRARQSRGFGRKSYPIRMWGTFAGQLMLRSYSRSRHINRSMIARGFEGSDTSLLGPLPTLRLRLCDIVYLAAWAAIIITLRFTDFTAIVGRIIDNTL